MITSKLIPGGGYGDCLPSGQYVSPIGKNVTMLDTSEGELATIFNPLYVSLSPDGHAWAAQCGNDSAGVVPGTNPENYGGIEYLVAEKLWRDITDATGKRKVVGGTDPCIYDNDNILHVHPVGPHMPTGGYRYVDEFNNLIDGDATYGPCPEAPRITQWTKLTVNGKTLVVGQGDSSGAAVFFDGQYRSLTDPAHVDRLPIDAFSVGIKGRNAGEKLSFYVHQSKVPSATCLWMDVADVETLPLYPEVAALAPNVASVEFAGFWLADGDAPGNLAIGSPTYTVPEQACVLATEDKIAAIPAERRLGLLVYLGGGSDQEAIDTIERNVPIAEDLQVPMFVYDDRRAFRYSLIKECCGDALWVAMPQWYLNPGEDPAAFVKAVIALVKTFEGRRILPVIRAYTGGVNPALVPAPAVVRALNELVTQDALKLPGFLGWIFFAWNRADGAKNIPAIVPAVEAWMQTPTTVTDASAWAATLFSIPPVEIPTMNIPAPIQATIQQFAGAFPPPHGDGSESWMDSAYRNPPNGWMRRLCQQLCFSHGPTLGHKRRNSGAPLSAGSFAIKQGDVMQVFDILISVGLGTPTLDLGVDAMTVQLTGPEAQEFVPVPAVNHLGDLKPTPGRAILSGRDLTVSSFDNPVRVANGDLSWCEGVSEKYDLIEDVFVYANGSGGIRLWRDAENGLLQCEKYMEMLARRRRRAIFRILCGTGPGNDNWSEDQSLDYLGRWNALAVRFLETIYLACGGNELTHGIEASYLATRAFWAKGEALIDPRIPFSPGAGHGGESVSFLGGSVVVHHADRGRSPEENGAIMATAREHGFQIGDAEPIGTCEVGKINGRQRVDTTDYGQGQLAAMDKYDLTFVCAHIDAGLNCDVNIIGPVQTRLLELFDAAKKRLGPVVVTPPPAPGDLTTLGEEARASAIKIAYDELLGRPPDPVGVKEYTDRLKSGWTVAQMYDHIRQSAEYKAKHGG